jgi:hypothetical protein
MARASSVAFCESDSSLADVPPTGGFRERGRAAHGGRIAVGDSSIEADNSSNAPTKERTRMGDTGARPPIFAAFRASGSSMAVGCEFCSPPVDPRVAPALEESSSRRISTHPPQRRARRVALKQHACRDAAMVLAPWHEQTSLTLGRRLPRSSYATRLARNATWPSSSAIVAMS